MLLHAAALGGADQLADAGAVLPEVEHAGRRSVDAHLVLDGPDGDVVASEHLAAVVDLVARHDEQAEPLGAGRRTLGAREHQVHDVLGEVVVAGGDEDLGAFDLVSAVGLLDRPGRRGADVGAGLRLGEAHRAGPLSGEHSHGVVVDLARLAEVRDHFSGADGEARVHRERRVGAGEQFFGRDTDGKRRARAAELFRRAHAAVARVVQRLPRFFEPGRRRDLAVLQGAALLVADAVGRADLVADEAVDLVENHVDGLFVPVGERRLAEELAELQLLE
jgi:hypothetical protein